jgi:hypothetical protein
MTIIVEDGSIVANANSYNTIAEVQAFADSRGYTLPADFSIRFPKAMDYLESLAESFKGSRSQPTTQSLQFPRTGISLWGVEVSSSSIPDLLKRAHCQAIVELGLGELIARPTDKVKKSKVDVIETEYFDHGLSSDSVDMTKIESFLKPLINRSSLRVGSSRL